MTRVNPNLECSTFPCRAVVGDIDCFRLLCGYACMKETCDCLVASTGSIGLLSQLVPCDGGVMFRQTPADYNYSWHNAPQRQFIVNLDADVKVTVSTGETRTIKQGEVFFVEDTHGLFMFSLQLL